MLLQILIPIALKPTFILIDQISDCKVPANKFINAAEYNRSVSVHRTDAETLTKSDYERAKPKAVGPI
jgi:hypothetical protein